MYKWGFQMGLPIFYYQTDVDIDSRVDLAYGSKEFRKVTKLKSQVALEILRMGYDVIWTDTDIAWLQNPLPMLAAMESDFVIQSNAPSSEVDANGPLRINSGFYRIRSSPIAIAGLEVRPCFALHVDMSGLPYQCRVALQRLPRVHVPIFSLYSVRSLLSSPPLAHAHTLAQPQSSSTAENITWSALPP